RRRPSPGWSAPGRAWCSRRSGPNATRGVPDYAEWAPLDFPPPKPPAIPAHKGRIHDNSSDDRGSVLPAIISDKNRASHFFPMYYVIYYFVRLRMKHTWMNYLFQKIIFVKCNDLTGFYTCISTILRNQNKRLTFVEGGNPPGRTSPYLYPPTFPIYLPTDLHSLRLVLSRISDLLPHFLQ